MAASPALDEMSSIPDGTLIDVASARLTLRAGEWEHQRRHRGEIDDSFARRKAENPTLFNGRYFILTHFRIAAGHIEGECVETNYASYLHWRAGGFGERGWNAFAMPVLHSSDGAVLLGEMAPWTANAGNWVPPAGSLDAGDLLPSGEFDLTGNIRRELGEEIGFEPPETAFAPHWTLVFTRGRLAMMRPIDLGVPAEQMAVRIRAALAAQAEQELSDIRFVRTLAEASALRMPVFLPPYLATILP